MDLGVGRGMVGLVVVGGVICNKSRHRRSKKRDQKSPEQKRGPGDCGDDPPWL